MTASTGYDVQEGTNVTFTCKANMGTKPQGLLFWSYIIGNSASPQDISYQAVKGPLEANETCSYTQVSTLQLTMKQMYNGVVLRCTLQQHGVSIAETREFNVSCKFFNYKYTSQKI